LRTLYSAGEKQRPYFYNTIATTLNLTGLAPVNSGSQENLKSSKDAHNASTLLARLEQPVEMSRDEIRAVL
jgi:hypothetical protein